MKNEDLYVYKKSDFYEDFISSQKEYYEREQVDALLAEKDKEIAELKEKLMPCLNGDCILTCEVVEKYGKENAELKKKLENVQASMYCDVVDAGIENRKLKRALYKACANWAFLAQWERGELVENWEKWENVERKCRAKAEEYK